MTPEDYPFYIKNVVRRYLPLQLALDLFFIFFGVRKRLSGNGKFEYDLDFEEKTYFIRQIFKTLLRHPQVTMLISGVLNMRYANGISHDFSRKQFTVIVLMPQVIGKFSIAKYSSLRISLLYSVKSLIYAILFQSTAPGILEKSYNITYETFGDVAWSMLTNLPLSFLGFIFFTPLVMHVVFNFRQSKKNQKNT